MKLHFFTGLVTALFTCASRVIPDPDPESSLVSWIPPANPMPGQVPQVRDDPRVKFLSLIRLAAPASGPAYMIIP